MITGFFCYKLRDGIDMAAYQAEAFRMYELVSGNPEYGLVDLKSFQGEGGEHVLVATFKTLEGIEAWRNDPEHVATQERGRNEFFDSYWGGEIIRHWEYDRDTGRRDTSERAKRLAALGQEAPAV